MPSLRSPAGKIPQRALRPQNQVATEPVEDAQTLGERTLAHESFDTRQMVLTGFRGYFPGDYVGLDTAGCDFVAAFTVANNLGLPVDFPQPPGLFVDA